jgi:hypothetical protein
MFIKSVKIAGLPLFAPLFAAGASVPVLVTIGFVTNGATVVASAATPFAAMGGAFVAPTATSTPPCIFGKPLTPILSPMPVNGGAAPDEASDVGDGLGDGAFLAWCRSGPGVGAALGIANAAGVVAKVGGQRWFRHCAAAVMPDWL